MMIFQNSQTHGGTLFSFMFFFNNVHKKFSISLKRYDLMHNGAGRKAEFDMILLILVFLKILHSHDFKKQ